MSRPNPGRVAARWHAASSAKVYVADDRDFADFRRTAVAPRRLRERLEQFASFDLPRVTFPTRDAADHAGSAVVQKGRAAGERTWIDSIIQWPDGTFSPGIVRGWNPKNAASTPPLYEADAAEYRTFKKWGNAPYKLSDRYKGSAEHVHCPREEFGSPREALRGGEKAVEEYTRGRGYSNWASVRWIVFWTTEGTYTPALVRGHSHS